MLGFRLNPAHLPTYYLSALETTSIDAKIDEADGDAKAGEQTRRNVRINQSVEIVQQESTLVWGNAGPSLQPVFRPCQRASPRQEFNSDAPHQAATNATLDGGV